MDHFTVIFQVKFSSVQAICDKSMAWRLPLKQTKGQSLEQEELFKKFPQTKLILLIYIFIFMFIGKLKQIYLRLFDYKI